MSIMFDEISLIYEKQSRIWKYWTNEICKHQTLLS